MDKNEVLQALQAKGFDVIDYLDTLIVHPLHATEISRNDILDALDHQINFQQIRQIDAFTIVIVF